MRVALKFGYNGITYHGYARQPNVPTIEGNIISHLKAHDIITNPKEAHLRSASRTDKGVSSLGNVLAFNTLDHERINLQALNNDLDDIFFTAKHIVSDDFYPRYANKRTYHYYLPKEDHYEPDRILETCQLFIGTHDFSNFSRIEPGKNPLRTLEKITLEQTEDFLIFCFCAKTFLWNQIRRIISAILQVEEEKTTSSQLKEALEKPQQKKDFRISSAHPLILTDVSYSTLTFLEDSTAEKNKADLLENLKLYLKKNSE